MYVITTLEVEYISKKLLTKACIVIDMAEATKTTLVNETLPTSSGSSAASSVTKPIKGVSKPCFGCGCGDEDCECVCVVM